LPRKRKSTKEKASTDNENKVEEIKSEETSNPKLVEIKRLLDKLKINGEIVEEDNKIKIIVGSLPDAFKLYRYGFYDVEVDESRSLIKRKK